MLFRSQSITVDSRACILLNGICAAGVAQRRRTGSEERVDRQGDLAHELVDQHVLVPALELQLCDRRVDLAAPFNTPFQRAICVSKSVESNR